ncbi:MAG: MetQ/NlpA family ABC transporter substrate-binding protein [Actinomycetota bacterium]|nr:MetQ/NlpA family ABC transporter substrate-binding protein [Actinomycetota bacterium]
MGHDDLGALSRRRFLSLAGAGAAAIAFGACGSDDENGSSSSQTTAAGQGASLAGTSLTTAVYAKNHASSPLFWQRFAPEGVKVEVKIFTSGSDMNRALQAGDLDFGLFGPYNGLIEKEQGFGSKVICMCSRNGIGIIGRKDRGIESIADLKGKSFAVPPPGILVLILNNLLERAGLKLDRDLKAVPLGYADMPAALERGDVDAYFGTEPLATQSVLANVGKRLADPYTTGLGNFNTAIWASPKMLARPEVLKAVTKMQRDAAEYLSPGGKNDPEVWKDLLVNQFGYSEAVYKEVLSNVGAEWRFDDARKSQFEAAAKEMRATGVLKKDVDFSQVFELQHQPQS